MVYTFPEMSYRLNLVVFTALSVMAAGIGYGVLSLWRILWQKKLSKVFSEPSENIINEDQA